MTEWRLDAFRVWKEMEEPDWANVNYEKPSFQDISLLFCSKSSKTKIR